MNQIIATAQQILDFKVGAISVGSVIQGLILLIIFNRIISMIMGPLIDKILDRFKLETTVRPVQRIQRVPHSGYQTL